ncbi:hypothetical protein D915_000582 [Fasciola hepatica]|uniref:Uncharacterized protein n=1 Tax=Fasciola hepatica TaxID=6192 RepID=A0A4E0RY53_FASHE|nr:hypothetical protein D915_000582 [Fasciola hepatica]
MPDCSCDICQLFHSNPTCESKSFGGPHVKLNDQVKLWGKFNGVVEFLGTVHFRHKVSIYLAGLKLDGPISFSSLCGYRLYCPRTERILVPPLFLKLLAPGSRGAPTTTGLEVSPNGPMIRKNRALFKESDPFVYQLRFGTK